MYEFASVYTSQVQIFKTTEQVILTMGLQIDVIKEKITNIEA